MRVTYKTKKLLASLTDDRMLVKKYGALAKKIKQRLNELESWPTLEDISHFPALHLHPLKGKRKEEWAITIQENWRLCFCLEDDPLPLLPDEGIDIKLIKKIKIIEVVDYH